MGLSKSKTSSMILLSVLIPFSLLATFRLVGIIPEPRKIETNVLEAANWKVERPPNDMRFSDDIKNVYNSSLVSVGVLFAEYRDNDKWNGLDYLTLMVFFKGSTYAVGAKFQPVDQYSVLDIDEEILQNPPRYPTAVVNMTVTGMRGVGTNSAEAFVEAKAHGSPSSLTIVVLWVFHDVLENNKNHTLKMSFEATYFNDTTYQRIIAPATLEVLVGGI